MDTAEAATAVAITAIGRVLSLARRLPMSSSLSLGGRTLDAGLPLYLCGRQGTPHGRRGEELNLVYTLSEGKITQLEGYYTSDEALEAAGLAE